MNRPRKKAELNGNAIPESASDPRRGLIWPVIVITSMALLSFVCASLR